MEPLRTITPETLIGEGLSSHPTFTRLDHLLSVFVEELRRMRNEAESQAERLLRMQLIESQLAKTRQKYMELQAQLAAVTTPAAPSSSHFTPLTSVCVVASRGILNLSIGMKNKFFFSLFLDYHADGGSRRAAAILPRGCACKVLHSNQQRLLLGCARRGSSAARADTPAHDLAGSHVLDCLCDCCRRRCCCCCCSSTDGRDSPPPELRCHGVADPHGRGSAGH